MAPVRDKRHSNGVKHFNFRSFDTSAAPSAGYAPFDSLSSLMVNRAGVSLEPAQMIDFSCKRL